jgi:hypothetical protein
MNEPQKAGAPIAEADWKLLERICHKADVPPEVVKAMLAEEYKVYGMGRRHGIHERLDEMITTAVRSGAGLKGGVK